MKTLNNYRGIFVVPILSLIFEKLPKNRGTPCLKQNMTPLQTWGVKGKGIRYKLLILKGVIDHLKYLQNEIWSSIGLEGTRPFLYMVEQFVSMGVRDHFFTLWRYPQRGSQT